MQMLFSAHSGLRYLVLLGGVAAFLYFAYAVATKKGDERTAGILGSAFVGLLDLQALLGIVMVVMGTFYPALIGHLVMMIGAAVIAHVAMAMGRKAADPAKANRLRLIGVVVALLLIVGGISAIGRGVFGSSGGPTVM